MGKVDLMPEATPRTLPTGPIPQVAYDQIIEEGWGDSVAQSLNNLEDVGWLTWPAPGSGTTSIPAPSSSSMAPWLEPGTLFIPDWVTTDSLIRTVAESIVEGSSGPNTYELQLSIGGITSGRVCRVTAPVGSGLWFNVEFSCLIDVTTLSGDQDVVILARRVSGSGVWTATTETAIAVMPWFRGPVGWYGE
jgi:hypothetical protein